MLSGLLGRGVALIAPFIVMPAMLRYLGDIEFGVWMTTVSITSMALFLDFGIGNGLLTHLSQAHANGDISRMRSYITSAYAALATIALFVVVIILIGSLITATWIPLRATQNNENSRYIVIVTLMAFAGGVPLSIIQRVLYACQKSALGNMWQLLGSIASVAFCFLAIHLRSPTWVAVSVYAGAPLAVLIVATLLFFRTHPQLVPSVLFLSKARVFELMRLGSEFFVLSIITSIALNLDNLVITSRLGAMAVAEYVVAAKLASILALIVTTAFVPLWAANAEAFAKKDFYWIKKTSLQMSLIGGGGVALLGLLLVISCDFIIFHWMGRRFEDLQKLMTVWAIFYTLLGVTSPFNMVLNSIGLVRVQIKAWIFFLVATLIAKYLILESFPSLWIVPLVSAIGYLTFIAPMAIAAASNVYSKKLASEDFSNRLSD
ncbi:oligosaccharide flippase family protein [Variovorax paradoxus]|uniref:oligosaccharide flippase family protein n=1 Tax=Variovorax paradoxus TaxID=34073 RepID=UPI00138F49FA|nr:oligosaccharide flippase family protein [Variovorax paradoxus]